jgi:hypothetical protein
MLKARPATLPSLGNRDRPLRRAAGRLYRMSIAEAHCRLQSSHSTESQGPQLISWRRSLGNRASLGLLQTRSKVPLSNALSSGPTASELELAGYLLFGRLDEVLVMFSHPCMGDKLPFQVELWDRGWKRRLETLTVTADFLTAKAAFEAAVKRRPREPILCDRARIVMRSGESRNE